MRLRRRYGREKTHLRHRKSGSDHQIRPRVPLSQVGGNYDEAGLCHDHYPVHFSHLHGRFRRSAGMAPPGVPSRIRSAARLLLLLYPEGGPGQTQAPYLRHSVRPVRRRLNYSHFPGNHGTVRDAIRSHGRVHIRPHPLFQAARILDGCFPGHPRFCPVHRHDRRPGRSGRRRPSLHQLRHGIPGSEFPPGLLEHSPFRNLPVHIVPVRPAVVPGCLRHCQGEDVRL